MPCNCYDSYHCLFDSKKAEEDLKNYKTDGPKKSSLPMLEMIKRQELDGLSLLDIGGGVGAVSFELMKNGIRETTYVDISKAYSEVMLREAEERNLKDKVTVYLGDFTELAEKINPVDIVTLDKVICCYPDYKELVSQSVSKAKKYYAYIIPRDIWWVKIGLWIDDKFRALRKSKFKTYAHPVSEINTLIEKEGFNQIERTHKREWLIALFEKQ